MVDGLAFAEALRWHGDQPWFSGIHIHAVHCVGADGRLTLVVEVPGPQLFVMGDTVQTDDVH